MQFKKGEAVSNYKKYAAIAVMAALGAAAFFPGASARADEPMILAEAETADPRIFTDASGSSYRMELVSVTPLADGSAEVEPVEAPDSTVWMPLPRFVLKGTNTHGFTAGLGVMFFPMKADGGVLGALESIQGGFLVDLEAASGMLKLGAGVGAFQMQLGAGPGGSGIGVAGLGIPAVKLSVMHTSDSGSWVKGGQVFAGPELDVMISFLRFNFGVLKRLVGDAPGQDALVVLGLGGGF